MWAFERYSLAGQIYPRGCSLALQMLPSRVSVMVLCATRHSALSIYLGGKEKGLAPYASLAVFSCASILTLPRFIPTLPSLIFFFWWCVYPHSNKISRDGAASLAQALVNGSKIKSLYLDSNAIDDAGVASLAAALPRSCVEL